MKATGSFDIELQTKKHVHTFFNKGGHLGALNFRFPIGSPSSGLATFIETNQLGAMDKFANALLRLGTSPIAQVLFDFGGGMGSPPTFAGCGATPRPGCCRCTCGTQGWDNIRQGGATESSGGMNGHRPQHGTSLRRASRRCLTPCGRGQQRTWQRGRRRRQRCAARQQVATTRGTHCSKGAPNSPALSAGEGADMGGAAMLPPLRGCCAWPTACTS